jgi:hypothetical protein
MRDKSLLKKALSENLTDLPLLPNLLHPLNREEPTLVTAIRLAFLVGGVSFAGFRSGVRRGLEVG